MKEPQQLFFFQGAMLKITFNQEDKFSNTQFTLLYDLPNRVDIQNWQKVKILKAPTGLKDIEHSSNICKQFYIEHGFIEIEISSAP